MKYSILLVTAILSLVHSYAVEKTCKHGIIKSSSSRRQWFGQMAGLATTIAVTPPLAFADDGEIITPVAVEKPSHSIEKCSTTGKGACVSTANVRNLDLYLPPWTFDQNPDEVMARLKGAIAADPGCKIVDQDGNQYLKVEAERNDLFGSIDSIQFVINEKDQVVFFRSNVINNESGDFGFNKKRLSEIRKRAGIFGVMGESMMSADSATNSERGNGPLGQLKAFYGLQSGGGFEDVVLE